MQQEPKIYTCVRRRKLKDGTIGEYRFTKAYVLKKKNKVPKAGIIKSLNSLNDEQLEKVYSFIKSISEE